MGVHWFKGLSAARRFGAAVRLQDHGRLDEAREALLRLNEWMDTLPITESLQLMTTRLMSLVHLAQVEMALGRHEEARNALRRWLSEWEGMTSELPRARGIPVLAKWEAWVTATLTRLNEPRC